jgi:hypothetical protein
MLLRIQVFWDVKLSRNEWFPMFQRITMPSSKRVKAVKEDSLVLKKKAPQSIKTSVTTHPGIPYPRPESKEC